MGSRDSAGFRSLVDVAGRPSLWLALALASLALSLVVPAGMYQDAPRDAFTVLAQNGWIFLPIPFYVPAPALLVAARLIAGRRPAAGAVAAAVSLVATVPALASIDPPLPGIVFSYATPVLVLIAAAVGGYRKGS